MNLGASQSLVLAPSVRLTPSNGQLSKDEIPKNFVIYSRGDPNGVGDITLASVIATVDANKDGLVAYPNVDLAIESVNMLEASRAYEANITMMETSKAMLNSSLRLLA